MRKKSCFTLQLLNVVNEQISRQALMMMMTLQLSIAVICQLRLSKNSTALDHSDSRIREEIRNDPSADDPLVLWIEGPV